MQPALAPAPHPGHNIPQENTVETSSWFSHHPDLSHQSANAEGNADLREQLLAAQVVGPPPPSHHPHGPPGMENMRPSNSASPGDHNIDPAIAGPGPVTGPLIPLPVAGPVVPVSASNHTESGGEDTQGDGSGRKASKRELSTSKRAAQNRAAQRAFRQRKEGYIKKLEEQVRDLHTLEENYKAVQAENYQLRDYIINLQSRLIESQGDYPQPPSNIDLPHPRQDGSMQAPPQLTAPTAPMVAPADQPNHLQASAVQAQAVAEMGNGNSSNKHPHEDAAAVIQQQQQQHQHQQQLAVAAAAAVAGNGYPSKRMKTHGEMDMDIPRTTTTDVPRAPMPAGMMIGAGRTRNIPMP